MFDKFFADIVAHPDDDVPRLVLADWLDEQGEPRGEFIRIQCELAKLDWDDPRFEELSLRETEILSKHRAKWAKEAAKKTGVAYGGFADLGSRLGESSRVFFHRGLLECAVFKDFKRFELHRDALVRDNLIRRVAFNELLPTKVVPFLQSPVASKLRSVDFTQVRLGEHLDALKESELAECAEVLMFKECHLGDYGIEKLLTPGNQRQEQAFGKVRELNLTFNSLRSPEKIKAVLAWPRMEQLRRLSLGLNSLENSIDLVARAKNLSNLFTLDLWGNTFGRAEPASFTKFCKAKHFTRLVQLNLSHCELKGDALEAAAQMKLPALRELDLGSNMFGMEGLEIVAAAKWLPSIRRLDVGDNAIGDAGVARIASDPNFSQLTHLCLNANLITAAGVRALIDSETLNQVRYLNISHNKIDKEVLKPLKKRYPKAVVDKRYG